MLRSRILPFIGWILITLWNRLVRIRFVNRDIIDRLKSEGRNFIYAFWHGRQFLLLYHHRNARIAIPVSESRDGEILAGILKNYGYDVVRGSSKRKGERALIGMMSRLRKGQNGAISVDGPRGPLYEPKPGILFLAAKLNIPIVPATMSVRRYWILEKTWEKLMLPAPFTRGVVMYGEPIFVNGTTEEELETKQKELQSALNKLTTEADEYFNKIRNPQSAIRN